MELYNKTINNMHKDRKKLKRKKKEKETTSMKKIKAVKNKCSDMNE